MKKHFPGFVSFGCGGEGRLEEVQGRLREEGFQVFAYDSGLEGFRAWMYYW